MGLNSVDDDYLWRVLVRMSAGKGVFALIVWIFSAVTEQWTVFAVYTAEMFFAFFILLMGRGRERNYVYFNLPGQLFVVFFGFWFLARRMPQFFGCTIDACAGFKKDFFYAWWGVLWMSLFFNAIILGCMLEVLGAGAFLIRYFRPRQHPSYKDE